MNFIKSNINKILIIIFILLIVVTSCFYFSKNNNYKEGNAYPVAKIDIDGYGEIVAELYPDKAPNTVNNFIELAESGFYDGLIFHRIVEHFVIQGGDPMGTGSGDAGYKIKGEFSANNFNQNNISHEKGILSMARSMENDSASSQFFIVAENATYLDSQYAGFGKVIKGMEHVDKIQKVEVDASSKPLEDVVIKSIKIERNGYKFKNVEKIENK